MVSELLERQSFKSFNEPQTDGVKDAATTGRTISRAFEYDDNAEMSQMSTLLWHRASPQVYWADLMRCNDETADRSRDANVKCDEAKLKTADIFQGRRP